MRRLMITSIMMLCVLILGCSKSEVIGYTYDLDNENNVTRLSDIYTFEYEISDSKILGEMKINNDIVEFDANEINNDEERSLFTGKLKYGSNDYNFDIIIYNSKTATGLFYDASRTFVKGFVIEKIIE